MTCPRCEELNLVWLIRTPGELRKAIRIVRGNVDDGTIRVLEDDASIAADRVPFSELPETGPWSYIDYSFACMSCGKRFELVADADRYVDSAWRPKRSR